MPHYVAVHKPGTDITLTASAAITGGRLVAASGSGTVAETAGQNESWLGVATTDTASGAKVGITSGGVQELTAAAAVTAGQLLVSAAAGQVAPVAAVAATVGAADVTNARAILGMALTSAAAGAKVRVKMER